MERVDERWSGNDIDESRWDCSRCLTVFIETLNCRTDGGTQKGRVYPHSPCPTKGCLYPLFAISLSSFMVPLSCVTVPTVPHKQHQSHTMCPAVVQSNPMDACGIGFSEIDHSSWLFPSIILGATLPGTVGLMGDSNNPASRTLLLIGNDAGRYPNSQMGAYSHSPHEACIVCC